MEVSKTQAIADWPRPRNVRELRQFLGMCGFYRRYINQYSRITAPLSDQFKKKGESTVKPSAAIDWSPEAQAAFDELKSAMQSAPMLIPPDPTKPFILHTDASDQSLV